MNKVRWAVRVRYVREYDPRTTPIGVKLPLQAQQYRVLQEWVAGQWVDVPEFRDAEHDEPAPDAIEMEQQCAAAHAYWREHPDVVEEMARHVGKLRNDEQ